MQPELRTGDHELKVGRDRHSRANRPGIRLQLCHLAADTVV